MGYFFFFLTVLCYIGLALLTVSQPSTSGNDAMGYGLALGFIGLALTISSLALTITMLVKGNFQWIAIDVGARVAVVLIGWFVVILTTFFCAVFKTEWRNNANAYPEVLHWLAVGYGQIWIPLLWLVACFLSLNTGAQAGGPSQVLKLTFYGGLLISSLYSIGLAVGYLRESAQQYEAEVARQQEQSDSIHQEIMRTIAAHKPTDPLVRLLDQTTQVRPADIREAAVAKVKTYPNWEAQLLDLLRDKQTYRDVYYFLDGNAVTNPDQFAEPLNQSIVWLAETIEAEIKDSNNLQDWSFEMYQIDNLLRAIDGQFLNRGVDFYPNVVKLKQALTSPPPERFKGIRFTATDSVEQWLGRHKPSSLPKKS